VYEALVKAQRGTIYEENDYGPNKDLNLGLKKSLTFGLNSPGLKSPSLQKDSIKSPSLSPTRSPREGSEGAKIPTIETQMTDSDEDASGTSPR